MVKRSALSQHSYSLFLSSPSSSIYAPCVPLLSRFGRPSFLSGVPFPCAASSAAVPPLPSLQTIRRMSLNQSRSQKQTSMKNASASDAACDAAGKNAYPLGCDFENVHVPCVWSDDEREMRSASAENFRLYPCDGPCPSHPPSPCHCVCRSGLSPSPSPYRHPYACASPCDRDRARRSHRDDSGPTCGYPCGETYGSRPPSPSAHDHCVQSCRRP